MSRVYRPWQMFKRPRWTYSGGDFLGPCVVGSGSSGAIPGNSRLWTNVDLMLGQRRRRWTNIKPTFHPTQNITSSWYKSQLAITVLGLTSLKLWTLKCFAFIQSWYCQHRFQINTSRSRPSSGPVVISIGASFEICSCVFYKLQSIFSINPGNLRV